MIKCIFFDLAGVTAIDNSKKNVQEFGKKYGYDNFWEIYHDKLDSDGIAYWRKLTMGKISEEDFVKIIVEDTEIPFAELYPLGKTFFTPNKEMLDFVKSLPYKTGLLTNAPKEWMQFLIDEHNFKDYFDYLICSGNEGIRKPNEEFFKLMVTKTGFTKEEIFYTDDKEKYTDIVNNLGIKAVPFTTLEALNDQINNL